MRELVRQGQGHPVVRTHAERAVVGIPPGRPLEELRAVFDYLGQRVDYRRDPVISEWLQTPWYLLACQIDRGQRPQLDCDDLTTLLSAMLASIGYESALRVVSLRPTGEFSHVYTIAFVAGYRVPMDLTRYHVAPETPWPRESRAFELAI